VAEVTDRPSQQRREQMLTSLQVNGTSPKGVGWRACSVTATTRKAWASRARVVQQYQER
jgi:hypothetical protein